MPPALWRPGCPPAVSPFQSGGISGVFLSDTGRQLVKTLHDMHGRGVFRRLSQGVGHTLRRSVAQAQPGIPARRQIFAWGERGHASCIFPFFCLLLGFGLLFPLLFQFGLNPGCFRYFFVQFLFLREGGADAPLQRFLLPAQLAFPCL